MRIIVVGRRIVYHLSLIHIYLLLRGFAKKLYLFYKKTHFRLYKKQKTESQGSPSVRFFCFMLYRGWGAAFYQTPATAATCCVLPYPCHATAAALRFAISPAAAAAATRRAAFCHIPAAAAFCHIPAALRPRRRVLPYPCRAAVCHVPVSYTHLYHKRPNG